jgi:hypothetical protein
MTVAVSGPRIGALMRDRADHRAELGLDQSLVDRFGRMPDPVINLGGLQRIQNLKQGRLVQGHRALCPSARTLAWSR